MGLATDYCVKFTALDALQLGYETFLIEDGCRGVELAEGEIAAAILEMKSVGARHPFVWCQPTRFYRREIMNEEPVRKTKKRMVVLVSS